MFKYSIISDSSCDLTAEELNEYGIGMVSYYVTLDGNNYKREAVDITLDEFYGALENKKVFPKTSLPPISDYINVFKDKLEQGMDILCICLTSKFSGSYQSANIARDMLKEKYPDRKILIVDSMLCTGGQGVFVLEAARLREQGRTMEETADIINDIKLKTKIIFTVDSLEYLRRGGRIGQVSAVAGSLLNIKPIISMRDGELIPQSKIRGRGKAIDEVIQIAARDIAGEAEKYHIALVHSAPGDIQSFEDKFRQAIKPPETALPKYRIGVTIGTHIGPTVVGIVYMPKQ